METTRRNFLRLTALLPLALTSCRIEEDIADEKFIVPFKWWKANRPLSEYQEAQPKRPILAFFTAGWDMTLPIVMQLSKKEDFYKPLEDATVLCLIYDQYEEEELTEREMKRLNLEYLPQCIVTHPRSRKETTFSPYGDGDNHLEMLRSGMVDRTMAIINS